LNDPLLLRIELTPTTTLHINGLHWSSHFPSERDSGRG